jgi:hypothetical protein
MGLFEALADKKSMNAVAATGKVGSFKDFLRERGEYPFTDDDDLTVGIRSRKVLGMRLETLLAVALAFGITNVISFTLGAWNSDKAAMAMGKVKDAVVERTLPRSPVDPVVQPKEGPFAPRARAGRPIPPPRNRARVVQTSPDIVVASAAAQRPSIVEEARYTIRCVTLPGDRRSLARNIEKYFTEKGFGPARARKIGDKIVIETGAFPSCRSKAAKAALAKVHALHFKHESFRDAYFVSR